MNWQEDVEGTTTTVRKLFTQIEVCQSLIELNLSKLKDESLGESQRQQWLQQTLLQHQEMQKCLSSLLAINKENYSTILNSRLKYRKKVLSEEETRKFLGIDTEGQ